MKEYKCGICLDSGFMNKFQVCDNCNAAHKMYEDYKKNYFNPHKPNKDGNCINCTDPWDTVKYPCKYSEVK